MRIVVVSGASGALGQKVLEALDTDPAVERVVAIDRAPLRRHFDKVEFHRADLVDADLKDWFNEADSAVHLAWDAGTLGEKAAVPESNVEATRRFLEAASHVETFVHLSSATVYGARPGNPVPMNEDAPVNPNPNFPYSVQKAEVEKLVEEWSDDHPSAKTCILRPAVTVNGSHQSPLVKALSGTGNISDGTIDHPVQFLHVDDLCSAVLVALNQRLSGVYNVAPDGFLGDTEAKELAGAPLTSGVPKKLASWLSGIARAMHLAQSHPSLVAYNEFPWVVSNEKLKSTGWEPHLGNEEALVTWQPAWKWAGLSPQRQRQIIFSSIGAGVTASLAGAGLLWRNRLRK